MKKRWLWLIVLWVIGWLVALSQMFELGTYEAPVQQKQQQKQQQESVAEVTPPRSSQPVIQTKPALCESVKADFLKDYSNVKASIKWDEPIKFGLRGRYADGDAFCGRYLLWNITNNDIWALTSPSPEQLATQSHVLNQEYTATLTNCGQFTTCSDIYLTARLVGKSSIVAATVTKYREPDNCKFVITYRAKEPGDYELHIKIAELNGTSPVATDARSLGIDRSRIRINGKKLFAHLVQCAKQRHIIGSPFKVSFEGVTSMVETPTCRFANYTRGRWVPFSGNYCSTPQPYCAGNPWWLADAYGFNGEWLWAPDDCKYKMYSPPVGPLHQCFERKGQFAIVGDSLAREYVQSCKLFYLNNEPPGFHCDHWHMIIKGEFFSKDYARSVVKVVIDKIHSDKPVGIGVNLGMMHMVGMCNDTAWEFFVSHFAEQLQKRPVGFNYRKIWLGAPQVHYATLGMSEERATRWDEIALHYLSPLGFEYLNATAITYAREEGSWDGLHNAAEKGRKQSIVVNRKVKQFKWNGGIAHMLWIVLLNLLCPDG
eukprot:TRINITY_DN3818_c1_g1_i1.p1 TRINITY_DN3818_c1_g1~~TRINITY_DN3818_c1_g1_i1.p1  ORF type:complete len:566 (+),score=78.59 TRINITY_DN3818_c1_g1_i1:74-1699(+)